MVEKSRIGFFTPSLGIEDTGECLEFVKNRGGLIQAWTLSENLAHERKPGLEPGKLLEEIRSGGIRVSSLSGYMDWTDEHENDARRGEFKSVIRQCGEFGCDIVCTETGRKFESRKDERAWKILADSMKELCAEAEAHGVYIAIEMGPADIVFGAEGFGKLQHLVGSPRLKVNFDPANLVRGGLSPDETLLQLKDEVVQVHIKDADIGAQRPLSEGAVDFKSMAGILEENSYAGNYIIEAEYPAENKPEAVARDYEKILDLIGQK